MSYWLTNFVMNGSGQDPASDEIAAPYTFCAVLIRRGQEPELHVGLPTEDLDLSRVVCGKMISHPEELDDRPRRILADTRASKAASRWWAMMYCRECTTGCCAGIHRK